MTVPGTHDLNGAAVEWQSAMAAWVSAARPVLLRLASSYGSWITYGDLAKEVQDVTGIFTRKLIQYWVGEVAFGASRPDEPLLSSLVVSSEHLVGDGYLEAVRALYGPPDPADLQEHAAAERLKCYQHFGADLPAGGGQLLFPPKLARRRSATRRQDLASRPSCPIHHLILPLSGQCDLCE